jgi:hypothetical protein
MIVDVINDSMNNHSFQTTATVLFFFSLQLMCSEIFQPSREAKIEMKINEDHSAALTALQ